MSAFTDRQGPLFMARLIAIEIGRKQRGVHAMHVEREMEKRKISGLGNRAGNIFKGPEWEFSGRYKKNKQRQWIKVWTLKAGYR